MRAILGKLNFYSQAGQILRSMGSVGQESASASSASSTTSSPNFSRARASNSALFSSTGPVFFEAPLSPDDSEAPKPLREPRLLTFSVYFSPFNTLSIKQ